MTGREAFRARGLRAKKSFGQCFLADPNIARLIAREATTPPGGTTLELGAGTGALTGPLLQRAGKVVAVERDRDLLPVLREAFASYTSTSALQLVEDDAAQCDWRALVQDGPRPHVVAGNLPYQITGRLLERAAVVASSLDRVVFMVQKEVADRLAAEPATREYGMLTVFMRRVFVVRKRVSVPASCFRPKPKVDSAVIVLEPRQGLCELDAELFEQVVRAAFSQRRKTLRNSLRQLAGIEPEQLQWLGQKAGVDLDARAETLAPEDYEQLALHAAALRRGL